MTERVEGNRPEPTEVQPEESLADSVTLDDIQSAHHRIRGKAHHTPVYRSNTLDRRAGSSVFLKCENFQRVGAFKFRGACNAVLQLPAGEGVLTYSSGNHAQAVALSAALSGRKAVIVMPENAPQVKLAATRGYLEKAWPESRVELYDPAVQTREELGAAIAEHEGLTIIPPYDHPHVIAGQGTAALELFEQMGQLDALFVPCGGGGLLSGSAVAARGLSPGCRVIGVEPEFADDASLSFRTGKLHRVKNPETIADGARTPSLGRYTFALVRSHVSSMMTVSEAEIARATLFAWERLKLVVEPSGALGLAGVFRAGEPGEFPSGRVGVIISGGNVDFGRIPDLARIAGWAG